MFSAFSTLGAQAVGVGYQVARSDQPETREARGLSLRVRFHAPIELRYDYLGNEGRRVDYPCGGLIPPDCHLEPIAYSSSLHSFFIAARAHLASLGSFDLFALPEVGLATGTIEKRSLARDYGISGGGGGVGAGVALELSATRVGGSVFGGWIAGRLRRFAHQGAYAVDGYEPYRELNQMGSVELGVTVALGPR
jgi:hypothetical protein